MAELTNDGILLQNGSRVYTRAPRDLVNREKVLNYFFRFGSITNDNNEYKKLTPLLLKNTMKNTNLPYSIVLNSATEFMVEATQFSRNLSLGLTSWGSRDKTILRQAKFYLRKAYKIVPVFDYSRAIINLEILHKILKKNFFWPRITTKLALTLFVTDKNDSSIQNNEYILQKNLRAFCACSAYAFHMARKKLKIDKMGRIFS